MKLVNPNGGFMMKRNFLAYGFIGGFALFLSLGSQPAKAQDWFQQGREFIEQRGNDIYHNVVSPRLMQYWAYTIPSGEVQRIKNQFRAAAGGEFQRICTEHSHEGDAGRRAANPLLGGSNNPLSFALVQWREENGVVNCYRRLQR